MSYVSARTITYITDSSKGSLQTDGYPIYGGFQPIAGHIGADPVVRTDLDLTLQANVSDVLEFTVSCALYSNDRTIAVDAAVVLGAEQYGAFFNGGIYAVVYRHNDIHNLEDHGTFGQACYTVQAKDIDYNDEVTVRPMAEAHDGLQFVRANDYYPLIVALRNLGPQEV